MPFRLAYLLPLIAAGGFAQQPQLSPLAAYEQATRPIEIVHRSVGNWSDSETASLAVAIKNGAEACGARKPEDFTGDELIAYARLCSLGIQWPTVDLAATRYIESKDELKPQLALAYGMKLEAELQAQALPQIVATAKAMLSNVPYDGIVDAAINEAFDYMQLAYSSSSLELHQARQPLLLAMLALAKLPLPRQTLYADGLAYAAEQQYVKRPDEAAETVRVLDAALASATLTPDEVLLIAPLKAQYAMLGQPLPKLTLQFSLETMKPKPVIDPELSAATALLVFPPWCAQCVRMSANDLLPAATVLKRGAVQLYALVAAPLADLPPLTPAKPGPGPVAPLELLRRTPTIIVPPETTSLLHATDLPWVVVTDHAGIVRFMGVAPENGLQTGRYVDRATDHVAELWPSKFVPVTP